MHRCFLGQTEDSYCAMKVPADCASSCAIGCGQGRLLVLDGVAGGGPAGVHSVAGGGSAGGAGVAGGGPAGGGPAGVLDGPCEAKCSLILIVCKDSSST